METLKKECNENTVMCIGGYDIKEKDKNIILCCIDDALEFL